MTNIDKEREDFEAWWNKQRFNCDKAPFYDVALVAYKAGQARAKQHSCEAVAWMLPNNEGYDSLFRDNASKVMCKGNDWSNWIPLYLSPQQPQGQDKLVEKAVAEALKSQLKSLEVGLKTIQLAEGDYGIGLGMTNIEEAIDNIRNLINQPTQNASPCKGKNCGTTDNRHSQECQDEHEDAYRSNEYDTAGNRNPSFRYAGYKGYPLKTPHTSDQYLAYCEGIKASSNYISHTQQPPQKE